MNTSAEVTIRHDLQPGDIGRVTEQHGVLYASEYGFDHRFEAYVAEGLGEFGRIARADRDRLWLAEVDGRLVGSIAILGREDGEAQLRWYLVAPEARGRGLGRRLLDTSIQFCRDAGYSSIDLWTVDPLHDAARRYTAAGFRLTEESAPASPWGVTLSEQRYDLKL